MKTLNDIYNVGKAQRKQAINLGTDPTGEVPGHLICTVCLGLPCNPINCK